MSAGFALDVRGLAAIYTGHLAPALLPLLELGAAPEEEFALAAAACAGPRPCLPDFF